MNPGWVAGGLRYNVDPVQCLASLVPSTPVQEDVGYGEDDNFSFSGILRHLIFISFYPFLPRFLSEYHSRTTFYLSDSESFS